MSTLTRGFSSFFGCPPTVPTAQSARAPGKGPQARHRRRRTLLPSWLRRLPRGLVTVGLLAALLGTCGGTGFLLWKSGRLNGLANTAGEVLLQASAVAGLKVDEVLVEGRIGSDRTQLLNAIQAKRGDPILGIDLHQARADLEKLPWVVSATVERRLPDTLYIRLTERKPMALWQHDHKLVLIDRDGNILSDQGIERFARLPIVVGADAPANAPALLAMLAAEPVIAARVEAAVRVSGRRWDLRLDNGIDVRLPETDVPAALHRLAGLTASESLFDRDIVAIDLRLADRMVVRTNAVGQNGSAQGSAQGPAPIRRKTQGEKI
ncbi:cell division protein FtsQ [uncultured Gammaproteobacteria bacterium]